MFQNTFRYLRYSNEPIKTIIIGGFFSYYGVFFLIPTVLVMGYYMQVIRGAVSDQPLPGFGKWKNLFIDGMKAYLIWLIYLLIPLLNLLLQGELGRYEGITGYEGYELFFTFIVVLSGGGLYAVFIPFGGRAVLEGSGDPQAQEAGFGLFDVSSLQQIIEQVVEYVLIDPYTCALLLLVWYITPSALMNFAHEGSLRAGFEIGAIRSIITSRRYMKTWIVFFGLWAISFSAILSWQITAVGLASPWQFVSTVIEQNGFPGIASELHENLIIISSMAYFALSVVAYAFIGSVYDSIDTNQISGENK